MASDFNGIQSASELQRAFEMGRHMTQAPMAERKQLTVPEIERLAKAGVTVDLSQIDIVAEQKTYFLEHRHLMEPLMHRLRLAFPLSDLHDNRFSHISAAPLHCQQPGALVEVEKVAVTVVTVHGNAALLEDDYKSFPSEALMAKIHLLLETETKRPAVLGKGADGGQLMDPRYRAVNASPNSILAGAIKRFGT